MITETETSIKRWKRISLQRFLFYQNQLLRL